MILHPEKNEIMRVLLISPVGEVGGAEVVILNLAKQLLQNGHMVFLASLRPGPLTERAEKQGVKTFVFQEHRMRNIGKVLQAIQWLSKIVTQTQADIIHSNYTAHLYGCPASFITRKPEIWHIHDYPYKSDFIDRFNKMLPSRYVMFTTDRVQSGYPALRTHPHSVVLPTCIEPERLRASRSQPNIRECYQLPSGPLFITVARLQSHKGHSYLIDAVPGVLQAYPDAMFAIVGKANGPEQEAYLRDLIEQSSRLGVSDRVRFLGYVPDEDLVPLYREATALVHPATSEGFGLTLLEAMAVGTPVIAAAADGPQEIITNNKTGILVPLRSSIALTDAMIRLLMQPKLATDLQAAGRIYADNQRLETMVEKTVNIYKQILNLKS
jgi:glycosyltransferase involved in cell wall biosynthesis